MHHRSIFNSANISMEQGKSWKHRYKMNGTDCLQRIDVKGWFISTLLLSTGPNETCWECISAATACQAAHFTWRVLWFFCWKECSIKGFFSRIYFNSELNQLAKKVFWLPKSSTFQSALLLVCTPTLFASFSL